MLDAPEDRFVIRGASVIDVRQHKACQSRTDRCSHILNGGDRSPQVQARTDAETENLTRLRLALTDLTRYKEGITVRNRATIGSTETANNRTQRMLANWTLFVRPMHFWMSVC